MLFLKVRKDDKLAKMPFYYKMFWGTRAQLTVFAERLGLEVIEMREMTLFELGKLVFKD